MSRARKDEPYIPTPTQLKKMVLVMLFPAHQEVVATVLGREEARKIPPTEREKYLRGELARSFPSVDFAEGVLTPYLRDNSNEADLVTPQKSTRKKVTAS